MKGSGRLGAGRGVCAWDALAVEPADVVLKA